MSDPASDRQFVPFESLWNMRIDVPYSLLVRDGEYAWSCGQLALDHDSNVVAPNDLPAQSTIVAKYIAEIINRGGLDPKNLKRLLLYYVSEGSKSDASHVETMRSAFRAELGSQVLLDPIAVPHFYYDGIVLEVDAFAGPVVDDLFEWESVEFASADLTMALDQIDAHGLLSAHWQVGDSDLDLVAADLGRRGLVHDAGAVVNSGNDVGLVRGSLVRLKNTPVAIRNFGDEQVHVTSKRSHGVGWIGAHCTNGSLGLVEQTEQIMEAIANALEEEGLGFDAVVKSTTLYVGGSSEEDLHDNMSVRNRRYAKPGPASTGLPVFGFASPTTLLTVDVTYLTS